MSSAVLLMAILISLLAGYLVADWQGSKLVLRRWRVISVKFFRRAPRAEDSRYYGVLTKLLNEQPDEALDQFISKMEVNAETLEMHLALGAHLRRRGEFNRAVRVHQNLLTRPGLPNPYIHQVQLELACDYWRSGLLDRAETLFKELMEVAGVNKGTRWQAAAHLVEIYQDLGEWLQAIDVADQLTAKKFADEPDHWRRIQAQYCCELVEQAMQKGDDEFVSQKLRKALAYDPESVRAHLLRADFALVHNDSASAQISLDYIAKHDASFLPETITRFERCLDSDALLQRLLGFQQRYPSIPMLQSILGLYLQQGKYALGQKLVAAELDRVAELDNEAQILKLSVNSEENVAGRVSAVKDFLQSKLKYRCLQCGTPHDNMVWLCPGCQSWATVRQGA